MSIKKQIDKAIRYFDQGRLENADKVLSEILLNDASNFDALYIKGVISGIQFKYIECKNYLLRAEKINPYHVSIQYNLAKVNSEIGDEIKALEHYKKIIKIMPKSHDAWLSLGVCQFNLKLFNDSMSSFEQVVEINSEFWGGFYNLANAQNELNFLDDALKNYDKAIKLNPDSAETYSNRGNLLTKLKYLEEALDSYNKAISLNQEFALAYFNRGNILKELNRLDEAIDSYNKAIELNNNFPEAYSNRGNVLKDLKYLDEAQKSYEVAIKINPQYAEAYYNLGNLFNERKYLEKAIDSYNKAIASSPNYALAYYARGNAYIELSQVGMAHANYLKAFELFPNYEYLHGTLLHTEMRMCDWQNFEINIEKIKKSISAGEKSCRSFHALALTDSLLLQHKAALTSSNDRYPIKTELGLISRDVRKQKIRIAYYSEDFREHAVAYLTAELFEYHNKNKFEVFGFYFGPSDESEMHKRISSSFDKFIEISQYSDKEVAQLSRNLGIDIAIDLNGYTGNERTGIFSYRAAPIQVSYIGYLGTMGTEYHDYIIADKTLIPVDSQKYYTEKIVYLPSYQANDNKRLISDKVYTRLELFMPENGFVFCCFNNNFKITPNVFKVWMRILNAVPDSILLIFAENLWAEGNLKKEAEKLGISIKRLVFTKRTIRSEYLAKYKTADLFLDTLPYNGGTTTSDALWAGLPVLTCLGESFASRVAASLLNAIELPELVTTTKEQYEAKAIELATNPTMLKAIKDKLERNKLTTALFDTKQYALHIESSYEQMYERYQTDLSPDHIYIGDLLRV